MIKVSALAERAISANSRTFLSRFLHNGAEISGDVRSVITYKGSCGESAFTPGTIYSSYIDVVIDNCQEALSGKELTYQIGVVIDENATEWYDIGKYTVYKPSTDVYTTSFTALGRISAKLGMLYQSKLTFPTTIQNILDEISGNTGVSIITNGFDTSGIIENEITGYMYREVLAIIAGIFFAYATEDNAGNIVFSNFKNGNIVRTDGDRTSVLPKFADIDTNITGVRVSGGEITVIDPETGDEVYQDQTFISGNANVAIQNEFMTQALFDANAGNVIGFTFRPATVSISLGDFRIEPFDSLLVTDSLGVERMVPCMSIIHRFDGGITTDIVAPELQDTEDSGTAFKGMMSQAIQRFQHELVTVKTLLAGTVTAEEVKANYATIENLNAATASIAKLQTDKLDASVADLKYATISNLNAAIGRISKLETDSLTAESAVIKALQTDKLDASSADLKYATISSLNATNANITKLQSEKATVEQFEAVDGKIDDLTSIAITTENLSASVAKLGYATITNLDAAVGRISKLEADSLTAESAVIKALQTDKLDASTADLKYATISNLDVANANVTKLQADKLDAATADLKYATITNLNAAVGRISSLETNSLTSESAIIKALQTGVADIETLIFGSATGTSIQTSFANAIIAQLGDAQIKSAMIENITADKITSGSINTNNVSIQSADGSMVIADNTIQIKDGSTVRVQIGKDTSGNYSIVICDTSGNVMFNTNGITADAIKSAIIRDAMVASNANISASKLDIDSLFTEINGSTNTIKSTKIYIDDEKQTLDVAFKEMASTVTGLGETTSSLGTQISAVQGQITSKIWQQDINSAKNELAEDITNLNTQYSSLNQSLSGLSATVGQHTSQITSKADKSTVTEVSNKVSVLEQNLDGFKSSVSSTYATKSTVNKTVKEVHQYYCPATENVIMPENKPTYNSSSGVYVYIGSFILNEGVTYTVKWKGVSYECVAFEGEFNGEIGVGLGNYGVLSGGASTGEPFVLGIAYGAAGALIMALDGTTGANNLTLSITTQCGTATKPTTYPPASPWSKTEPGRGGVCSTLCTVYVDGTFSYSDISVNTAGEIAANAKDEAQNAQNQVTQLSTRVTQTESSITSQASSISSLGTRMSTVEQTANGITISLQQTNSNVAAAQNAATAAQQAANKAQGEVDTLEHNVEKTYQKTVSKGEQLITNGNGLMGDNTNFSDWTFDGAIANNSAGSFTKPAGNAGTYTTDEYFPVNPTNEYTFSLDAKSAKGIGKLYSMLMFYDADKQQISAGNHIYNAASTTTLARDLKAGDTTIYLTSAAGWSTTYSYGFYMIIWNYKNSFGYTYPACTYSRTRLTLPKNGNYLNSANLDKTANTITLASAYSGATIPAGTSVSQGGDGGTYKYFPCSNTTIPIAWTTYIGNISGVDYSGQNKANTFPPGTAYAKVGFLWNYQGSGNGEQIWVTNFSVTDTTAASQAKAAADNAQSTADTAVSNAAAAQNTANNAQSTATAAQTAASNAQSTANTANSTANTARTEAAAAQTAANNSAKTATNYLKFDSSGLLVGDMTASTLGKNVLIYSGGVNIRDNTTVLASFTASEIHLGKNSDNALIYLCNAAGKIYVDKSNELYGFLTLESSSINLKGEALRLSSAKTNVSSTGHLIAITDSEGSYVSVAAQNSGGIAGVANVKFNVSPNNKDGSIVFTIESQSNGTQTLSLLKTNGLVLEKTDIFFKGGTQASAKGIKWDAINSKNPYIGYATDQVDGTFVWSITGTNYASGLAIGGGSGNLLYKGNNVLNAGNYTSYAPPKNHASADPGYGLGTNAKYGHVMLSDSTSSNLYVEAGYAATPAAVKAAYDKANHSHPYAPTAHASTDTTYGIGTSANYGHVKLSDSTSSTSGASSGIAASPAAVKAAYDKANHSHPYAATAHTHSYLPLTGGTISGATTFSEDVNFTKNITTKVAQVYALEISHATPFIDFHFGNSTADYTSRIIENSKGALTVSGTISQTSDRRMKENIMPLGTPQLMPVDGGAVETDLHSELFDRLKPVQYRFINGNGKICYGLIAQDVVDALREVGIEENSLDLVHHNFWTEKNGEEKEQYSVSYNSRISLLIHEVQKLKSQFKQFKGE